jgi:hypothetical protein
MFAMCHVPPDTVLCYMLTFMAHLRKSWNSFLRLGHPYGGLFYLQWCCGNENGGQQETYSLMPAQNHRGADILQISKAPSL